MEKDIMEQIRKNVEDPEIGINIVDLGLIYKIEEKDGYVEINMTMTTPMCPATEIIMGQTKACVRKIKGVKDVVINIVWEPIWSPEKMTEEGKAQVEMLGI